MQQADRRRQSGSRRSRRWVGAAIGSLLAVSMLAVVPAGASARGVGHGLRFKGAHHSKSNTSNLIDNGGEITPASTTYAIYWGSKSAWSSDVFSGMGTFFGGLNGSNYLAIANQYMRGSKATSSYGGDAFDASAPPSHNVTPATLGAEVQKVYGPNLSSSAVYFVYTSNFPKGGNFCAWHSFTTVNGQNIAVAYMPNTGGVAGCDPGDLYGTSGSEDLRSLANVTAHEFMEAITDTWPASGSYAWIDSSGSEIGDKCAWQFSGPVTLGKTKWQLQEEWSNTVTGCVQGS